MEEEKRPNAELVDREYASSLLCAALKFYIQDIYDLESDGDVYRTAVSIICISYAVKDLTWHMLRFCWPAVSVILSLCILDYL